MDDRRFDALARAVARGTSRRSVLKGLLGLGGVAIAGGALLEDDALAARRPTPTPKPPRCPGQQIPCAAGCCCPAGLETCGPACCTEDSIPAPLPGHSECCDGACCAGTCYGEELCCATNNRDGELPPLEHICASTDGTQCCGADQLCCQFDGCCDTICWGGDEFCCPEEAFCRGGGEVSDVCCVNAGSDLFACCNGGTDRRVCYDTSIDGACCTDADCADPCLVCNQETNSCGPRCDAETQVCCTGLPGPGVCVTGECCGFADCGEGRACCDATSGTVCVDQGFCPNPCSAEDPCNGCSTCVDGLCLEGCGAGAECCLGDPEIGETCVEAGACKPVECTCENEADCCFINDAFVGCVDLTVEGACCTADTCDEFNDFDNCLVGACTDFQCEQVSECLDSETCCNGDCVAGPKCCDNLGPQECCTIDDCVVPPAEIANLCPHVLECQADGTCLWTPGCPAGQSCCDNVCVDGTSCPIDCENPPLGRCCVLEDCPPLDGVTCLIQCNSNVCAYSDCGG